MVQVLPSQKNLGSAIGQSLGMGLEKGLGKSFENAYQAGHLQKAFQQLQGNENDPVKIAQALAQSAIYSPNAERAMAALAPLLLQRARTNDLYGNGQGGQQGGGAPDQESSNLQGQQVNDNTNVEGQSDLGIGQNAAQKPRLGGFLAPLKTPEQIQQEARYRAQVLGDPHAYQQGLAIGQAENQLAENSLNTISQMAAALPSVAGPNDKNLGENLPVFMQIAKRYGHLKDPNEIITSANRDFQQFQNLKTSLNHAFIPGLARGALQKIPGGGVLGSLISRGVTRDQALGKIHNTVKGLVDLGFEPYVRNFLSKQHLSPTEIEESIHPLSKDTLKNINSISKSNEKTPPEIRQKNLTNFFKNNVTPKSSLLVLRHRLWNDKNYDWNEIAGAVHQAETEGLKLTPAQQAEIAELDTQAPRQSFSDAFQDWGRWMDYLRGNK